MAVRKVSNRGGRNIIGKFPSIKMGDSVPYESLIEGNLCYLLDFFRRVSGFQAQPFTIEYSLNGKKYSYTPDFNIELFQTTGWVVDCKPHSLAYTEKNLPKFAAAREWCRDKEKEFHVITDQELNSGFLLTNVKMLTRYARRSVSQDAKTEIREFFEQGSCEISVFNMAKEISSSDPKETFANIFHLVFHHKLFMPLTTEKIGIDSLVYAEHHQEVNYDITSFFQW